MWRELVKTKHNSPTPLTPHLHCIKRLPEKKSVISQMWKDFVYSLLQTLPGISEILTFHVWDIWCFVKASSFPLPCPRGPPPTEFAFAHLSSSPKRVKREVSLRANGNLFLWRWDFRCCLGQLQRDSVIFVLIGNWFSSRNQYHHNDKLMWFSLCPGGSALE